MIPVIVYKNDIEMGWFKDLQGGMICVQATCKNHGFDISQYKLVCKETKNILWNGADNYNSDINTTKG